MSEKHSAIALVQRSDGRLLVVWNRRYGGWSLPGGMVEGDEDPPEACTRELREETGLFGMVTRELYAAPARASTVVEGRATIVHVFEVTILGANSFAVPQPSEQEEGCPVSWFTREDFLRWSPFAPFYREMFTKIGGEPPTRRACGIPALTLPPCDLEWGHDGELHANGGDGFFASRHLGEHQRRQAERKVLTEPPELDRDIKKGSGMMDDLVESVGVATSSESNGSRAAKKPPPSVISNQLRDELIRILRTGDDKNEGAFTVAVAAHVEKFAVAAREILMTENLAQSDLTSLMMMRRNHLGSSWNNVVGFGSDGLMPMPTINNENFGVQAIRQLVDAVQTIGDSPTKLVEALAVARSNNLPDVVAVLEKKLGVSRAGSTLDGEAIEEKVP